MHTINAVKRSLDHPNLAITGVIATFRWSDKTLATRLENIRTYFGGRCLSGNYPEECQAGRSPVSPSDLFLTMPPSRRVRRIRQSC